jgi:predicted DNA-binding transcriptional regulator AlpA
VTTSKRVILDGLPERLWSHQETADFLQLPAATLHQMNSKGTGPRSYRLGRYRRYDPRDVEAWLEKRASTERFA